MSKEKRRVPKLRFPGFTEDWEQCKLDDIAKIKTGGGTPKTANPEYWSGNIPWIQSSDLVEGDIEHVNINKFINNNALKNSAAKLISRDSIALVTRVSVGKVAVINQDFTTSQDFLSLSDFDGSDIKFLAYQLYRLMQENAKVLQGTSIKGITKTELIEQSISIPSSSEEQNLISNVLSKIDSIITLHQCKLEHLNLKKKALLQKLFPKNGECYPELRFPGFTDAWEQRKLEDICSYQSSSLTINDIDENGQYDLYDANSLIGKTNKGYMKMEYITIIKDGAGVGRTRMLPKNSMFLGTMGALTPKNKCLGFLYQLVTNANLGKICTGSTIPHIYFKDYGKLKFCIPSIIEQEVIGKFFNNIDYLITLHQRKLEHLQLQKKALLQQMFV